ncbi:MAG: hypothetical protein ACM31G_06565 [Flavobacteriales bacterium]
MQIHRSKDSIISRIFDAEESQIHYFHYDKSDSLKLKYLKTLNITKCVKDYTFQFSEIKKKQNASEITYKILNERKRKIAQYKLTIQGSDQNLFFAFKLSDLETLQFTKIIPPMNFIVLKAKGTNMSGINVKYELISIEEDFDLTVNLP